MKQVCLWLMFYPCILQVYYSFVTYLPSVGYEVGVGRQAPYLLSIIAIFELLAKVVMSFISDRGWIQRRYFIIIAAVNASLSTLSKYYD